MDVRGSGQEEVDKYTW